MLKNPREKLLTLELRAKSYYNTLEDFDSFHHNPEDFSLPSLEGTEPDLFRGSVALPSEQD